eukprot:scaffold27517_cov61-Phaeocystis_antarctica.AAC.2
MTAASEMRCFCLTKEGHSYFRPRVAKGGEDSLLAARPGHQPGYRVALSGSELRREGDAREPRAGAAARTVRGTCIRRTATHATGEGHTHWHTCGEGQRARGGARNPLQKSSSHLSPGKRCGATARSALARLVQTQCWCPRDVRRLTASCVEVCDTRRRGWRGREWRSRRSTQRLSVAVRALAALLSYLLLARAGQPKRWLVIQGSHGESDHRSPMLGAAPAARTQSLSAARRSALYFTVSTQ